MTRKVRRIFSAGYEGRTLGELLERSWGTAWIEAETEGRPCRSAW
jgi:hypothetical protein